MVDFFFFQAEDGIRDLVRSRGLGDVYKRQGLFLVWNSPVAYLVGVPFFLVAYSAIVAAEERFPVSYTHLTLPTSDLV